MSICPSCSHLPVCRIWVCFPRLFLHAGVWPCLESFCLFQDPVSGKTLCLFAEPCFLCTCLCLQSVSYAKSPYFKGLSPSAFTKPFPVCKAPPYLLSLWLFVEPFWYSHPLLVCLPCLNFPGWSLSLCAGCVYTYTWYLTTELILSGQPVPIASLSSVSGSRPCLQSLCLYVEPFYVHRNYHSLPVQSLFA